MRVVIWLVHHDGALKRIYVGSMSIANQRFLPAYEDPGSEPFVKMASLVSQQVSGGVGPRGSSVAKAKRFFHFAAKIDV